jgi:peptidoglycan/xylan/chitin deacetylase (PgdA/CDA1 family)
MEALADTFDIRISVLGVTRGLQRYPELARAFVEAGHEMVCHGRRWVDCANMPDEEER